MTTLPCIACGAKLESAAPDSGQGNQPSDGLCFHTPGHYGSTEFDPMDGSVLEVSICDACVRRGRASGVVLHRDPHMQRGG